MMKTIYTTLRTVTACCALSVGALASGSAVAGGPNGTEICAEQSAGARGICRAAVKSGCEVGGRREGSRHCSKLESNFRRETGRDPVWRLPVEEPEQDAPPADLA